MIWEKIRGHDRQVELFRQTLRRGRLSHAYLFVGAEGIGKKLFARALAQSLFCERFDDADLEACGECSSCRQMLAGSHPDFFSVGCPEGKSELPIDVFVGPKERRGREGLCYELSLRPMISKRKIASIDDANLMNPESGNSLLKTLEEPPPDSLLILIATNADGLLPTIRSRCQQVRFSALKERDIAELLLELELLDDLSEAESVAALSEGSLAVAGQLLDPGLRQLRDTLYNALAGEQFNNPVVAKQMLAGLDDLGGNSVTQRLNASWLIRFSIEFFRRALRVLAGNDAGGTVRQVEEFAARFDPASAEDLGLVMELVDRTALAQNQLDRRLSIPVCLEAFFHDLGRTLRRTAKS